MALILTLALVLAYSHATAHPLDQWTRRNPQPGGYRLTAVCYGAGKYVGVGEDGATATSLDGIHWQQRPSLTYEWLSGLVYADGQFVTVGSGGVIFTSTDGVSWSAQVSGTGSELGGVTWHGGLFVAVGSYGTLLTSPDGVHWTARDPGTAGSLRRVIYGDRFVAVGLGTAISSIDGMQWTPGAGTETHWYTGVAYANGHYVAAAGYGRYATSTNGIQWNVSTNRQFSNFGTLAAGNGFLVAIADGVVRTSLDGRNWTPRQGVMSGAITYGGDQFVITGSPAGATSPDGIHWTPRSVGGYDTFRALAVHGDMLVAAGEDSVLSSTNGVEWLERRLELQPAYLGGARDVIWADGKFVAATTSGAVHLSTNGIDWIRRPLNSFSQLEGIAWGNGRFVAVGTHEIQTSADGNDWQPTLVTDVIWWKDVAYADGTFVAVGDHGKVAVSTNGTAWTMRTIDYDEGYNAVAYGNGVWVTVGELSPLRASTNLVDWTIVGGGSLLSITWLNGLFIAGGRDGRLVSSPDGVNWSRHQATSSSSWSWGFAVYRDSIWVVGDAGTIAQSDPLNARGPSFFRQPSGLPTAPGTTFSLEIACDGTSPLEYQWTLNGLPLPEQTNAVLIVSNAQMENSGTYRIVVSNALNRITSDAANVTVTPPLDPAARLAVNSTARREFVLDGRPAARYKISYTTEPGQRDGWTPLKTITLPKLPPYQPFVWIDENATNGAQRFYRAEWNP